MKSKVSLTAAKAEFLRQICSLENNDDSSWILALGSHNHIEHAQQPPP
jgi:hypothetical protein